MKANNLIAPLAALAVFVSVAASAQSGGTATLTIQANQPGAVVSSNLFGIFFEEISMAGDGGIYGELVRNRSFEDTLNAPAFWSLVTSGTAAGQLALDTSLPMSGSNVQSLALTLSGGSGSVGAANNGYWGIPLTNGATYHLNFYARGAAGFTGAIDVSLESTNGSTVYAQTSFGGLTAGWQPFSASLVSSGTDANAQLVLRLAQAGTVYLDFVSLFPAATFNGRTNGLRPDLMNLLVDLQPAFMRFPGGSWVNGLNLANAYHWKPTVGFLPDRTVRTNLWGYMVNNGLGYHEYLLMCEDLGAQPMFNVNAGMAGSEVVSTANLGPWVQEALDAIEYANGSTNTVHGAMRAANGHPAPFNLQYIEIGNENGGSSYHANYAVFYDAIKAAYPGMNIIANVWGGIPNTRPVEIMDEHYYSSAATFISYATKYDTYSRTGPKVFVGEYAVAYTVGPGFPANLRNALGEAAFMTGMERNSDIVVMSCYAPLFVNVNKQSWTPDLIYFNGTQAYGTPSYYVQQMFYRNKGDTVLPTTVASATTPTNAVYRGAIGLGSWNTSVQYTNIVVTSNGVTLHQSDFASQGTNGWRVYKGAWSTNAGLYQQTSAATTDCRSTTGDTNWSNYTLSLRARKVSGSEGFLILFNWLDDSNWSWWNIGGWGNTKNGIEQMVGGSQASLAQVTQTAIATNVWYDIRIVLTGARIQCYLGTNSAQVATNLVQDVTYPSGVFASATYSKASGQIIVKAVNPYGAPMTTTFNLTGVSSIAPNATVSQLMSGSPADENSLAAPTKVAPATQVISNAGTNFSLTLPAYSLSVLRLTAGGINTYTNLLLQITSPINRGQTAASTVWGRLSGNWINLTTNSNHALTYASANPSIAVVDINGNVTGLKAGTASIIATYGALGLSATQSVQIISVPTALVHRYRFSETSGANVADSAGGPAWDGTLPNGGTFGGGQLALAAGSQQYVNLPSGILSNYTMVTVEAWATFGTLPSACFLYGFGNVSGTTGQDYIFCQPKSGRMAITDSDWRGEQAVAGGGDWSSRTVHVTSVFNPPASYIALYTNGVLVSRNSAVTVPFSSVDNVFSYIGRSLYSGDAYFDVSLDEFRIYNGALQADEIAATQALGPDQVLSTASPTLGASALAGNLTLSWPLAAAGFSLESRTNLATGEWTEVSSPVPQIAGGQWQITVPATNREQYFRLKK